MHVQASGLEVGVLAHRPVEVLGFGGRDPELALRVPRPRIRVRRLGVYAGVNAEPHGRHEPLPRRYPAQEGQLPSALDVEGEDPRVEPGLELPLGLPRPREDDQLRGEAGDERAVELAERHDVRPGSERRDSVQEREGTVRLHRVRQEEFYPPNVSWKRRTRASTPSTS